MKQNVLLIEDEKSIADTLTYALESDRFNVNWKTVGREGIQHAREFPTDLIILDVGLPDLSGFEVCKEVRNFSELPIIFLTARNDEIDRVVGLEIGADDYVVKPFSPREVVARVKAILKRTGNTPQTSAGVFNVDEIKGRITYLNTHLELTRYEYRLLKYLLSQPGRIFSREQIMAHVWDAPEASMDRTVDAHIKTLRAKLRDVSDETNLIKTHRGMGYSIEA
ncbi:two-component system response regulator CreB [Terasakiella sp. A23]|uniref:two-component system response regulator CreB n=1 Tax=Terasakiella sp. FCG-A23 TaxID=3080561 RepID=UPI0029541E3B|nr:two-component system response regulator CreB [Terasakiella sp. A23]MDV7339978.1 two-component system response regulator CreB [Terasakiella sp. A23]